MKTGEIIKKNIRLLLRSKVSTFVLILGPLLVIILVGLSFSTSTFNLKLGVYSSSYSELSQSFIDNLNNGSFKVTKYDLNETCIAAVVEQEMHACIIFPPDLDIKNGQTNIVKFYVDQSKVNLVYLVMSTLKKSVGEVSSGISRDLTDEIVTALFNTKTSLESSSKDISNIIGQNAIIITNVEASSSTLGALNFESSSNTAKVDLYVDNAKESLDALKQDSKELIEDARDLAETIDKGTLNSNQSNALDDLNDNIDLLETLINSKHNTSMKSLNNVLLGIDQALADMTKKLNTAKTVNTDVVNKLGSVKRQADDLKRDSETLKNSIQAMVTGINSVQVTNIENIVSPITTEVNEVVESKSNLGFLFPSLIVMLIMFIGLFLSSTLVIMEKNSKASFRVFTTPTKPWLFILATYLTSMLLILVQVTIILTVSQFYFDIDIIHSFQLIVLSLLIVMSFFIFAGMLVGYIFNTEEMSMLSSISLASLLLLTSGIIFPIESMPTYLYNIVKYNPVVAGSEAFRKALLFDSSFNSIKPPFFYLVIATLCIIGIILVIRNIEDMRLRLPKKIKKHLLMNQFDFGERKAKTLAEFIVSIQTLNEKRYAELLHEEAYKNWVFYIYKNKSLAKKIDGVTERNKLLELLLEEMKRNQKK